MWKHLAQFLFIQWNKSDQNSALWYALWWQQTPFLEICVWFVSREYILSVTCYVSLSGLIQKGKRDTEQRKFALPTSLPEAQLHVPISSRVLFTVDPSYNSWPHSYSFGGSKLLSCVCVTRILLILFNKVTGIGRTNSFWGTTDLYIIAFPLQRWNKQLQCECRYRQDQWSSLQKRCMYQSATVSSPASGYPSIGSLCSHSKDRPQSFQ